MYRKYSKNSSDIENETLDWIEDDIDILKKNKLLLDGAVYVSVQIDCIVCNQSLKDSDNFQHREVDYKICKTCNHIQASQILKNEDTDFDKIYPEIDLEAWNSRRDRIYLPKLDWILESFEALGINNQTHSSSWLDLGSGAGYFLDALKKRGIDSFVGIEEDSRLIDRANKKLQSEVVFSSDKFLELINDKSVGVITSWFVLEHLFQPWDVLDLISSKEKGTYFAFSVPTFGFAALLENISSEHAARTLDNLVHRQIYTDKSIVYLLNKMRYKKISEWVFGQDALDLKRMILSNLSKKTLSETDTFFDIKEKIGNLIDPIQEAIDKNHFSDSRHILSIKE